MVFNAGDRVQHKHEGLATVAGMKDERIVLLHFDNPVTEKRQRFSSGWSARYCTLVEDEPVVEEDWS